MSATILSAKPQVDEPATGIEDKKQIADGLSHVLAGTILLMIKTQTYHWNVVGPLFHSIHELTEEQYKDLFEAADDLAERIRALGFPVAAGFKSMIELADVGEPGQDLAARDMVADLVRDHETVVRRAREVAEKADDLHDGVTHDMLNGRMEAHEKNIWMLRALITE